MSHYWEKTVEYLFVLKYLRPESLVSPLDGNLEKAGDTVTSSEGKWILIEFKRSFQDLSSEEGKYVSYSDAFALFNKKDDHHLLIYGEWAENALELKGVTYFSKTEVSVAEYAAKGISFGEFKVYLDRLLLMKKPNKGDTSGSSSESYGEVAVVRAFGNDIECMSLNEFIMYRSKRLEIPLTQTVIQGHGRLGKKEKTQGRDYP